MPSLVGSEMCIRDSDYSCRAAKGLGKPIRDLDPTCGNDRLKSFGPDDLRDGTEGVGDPLRQHDPKCGNGGVESTRASDLSPHELCRRSRMSEFEGLPSAPTGSWRGRLISTVRVFI